MHLPARLQAGRPELRLGDEGLYIVHRRRPGQPTRCTPCTGPAGRSQRPPVLGSGSVVAVPHPFDRGRRQEGSAAVEVPAPASLLRSFEHVAGAAGERRRPRAGGRGAAAARIRIGPDGRGRVRPQDGQLYVGGLQGWVTNAGLRRLFPARALPALPATCPPACTLSTGACC